METRVFTASKTEDSVVCISFTVDSESSASLRISSATTENPFPDSPALADSIAAFNARRFVCAEICKIASDKDCIFSTSLALSIASLIDSFIFKRTSYALLCESFASFFSWTALLLISAEEIAPFSALPAIFFIAVSISIEAESISAAPAAVSCSS